MSRDYLSKDSQLEFGRMVQKGLQAESELQENGTLSPEETMILKKMVADGHRARNMLFETNVDLVHHRVRAYISKYPNSGLDYEDLVQEGQIGLVTAINKYDPDRENKLTTVAYYWIAQAITRAANKTGRMVRLPENRIVQFYHINQYMSDEKNAGKSKAELDSEVMKKFNLSAEDLHDIRGAGNYHASLNMRIGGDEGTRELLDFVEEDKASESTEETVISEDMHTELLNAIAELPEIKQSIIDATFSLRNTEITEKKVRDKYVIKKQEYEALQQEAFLDLQKLLTGRGFSLQDFLGG